MEDINIPVKESLTIQEQRERAYKEVRREKLIARMRASVIRKQITEAYQIIENIRFDYLGDTAFRDKIVTAKKGLEAAMSDFLLSDKYWEESQEKHNSLTPEEWANKIEREAVELPTQSE